MFVFEESFSFIFLLDHIIIVCAIFPSICVDPLDKRSFLDF